MERYLMYLRKSRMDTDFDEVSVEETLNRHRRILESFCKERRLNVVEVLEEVVSGESLSSRPKMLRLLELVNTGMYAGVICIDIERLSRGSSLESGYIMQVLQTNNCKIIKIWYYLYVLFINRQAWIIRSCHTIPKKTRFPSLIWSFFIINFHIFFNFSWCNGFFLLKHRIRPPLAR